MTKIVKSNSQIIAARCSMVYFKNAGSLQDLFAGRGWTFCAFVADDGPFMCFEHTSASGPYTEVYVTTYPSMDAKSSLRIHWTVKPNEANRTILAAGESDDKAVDTVVAEIKAAMAEAVKTVKATRKAA